LIHFAACRAFVAPPRNSCILPDISNAGAQHVDPKENLAD
jgi:hypothetical protein